MQSPKRFFASAAEAEAHAATMTGWEVYLQEWHGCDGTLFYLVARPEGSTYWGTLREKDGVD